MTAKFSRVATKYFLTLLDGSAKEFAAPPNQHLYSQTEEGTLFIYFRHDAPPYLTQLQAFIKEYAACIITETKDIPKIEAPIDPEELPEKKPWWRFF